MKHTTIVTIEVNGKAVEAVVTVDAPGLNVIEDMVDANMILAAAAKNQNTSFTSRHHKDRVAHILVSKPKGEQVAGVPDLAEVRRRKQISKPGASSSFSGTFGRFRQQIEADHNVRDDNRPSKTRDDALTDVVRRRSA